MLANDTWTGGGCLTCRPLKNREVLSRSSQNEGNSGLLCAQALDPDITMWSCFCVWGQLGQPCHSSAGFYVCWGSAGFCFPASIINPYWPFKTRTEQETSSLFIFFCKVIKRSKSGICGMFHFFLSLLFLITPYLLYHKTICDFYLSLRISFELHQLLILILWFSLSHVCLSDVEWHQCVRKCDEGRIG